LRFEKLYQKRCQFHQEILLAGLHVFRRYGDKSVNIPRGNICLILCFADTFSLKHEINKDVILKAGAFHDQIESLIHP